MDFSYKDALREDIKLSEMEESMETNPRGQTQITELKAFCENFPIDTYLGKENNV